MLSSSAPSGARCRADMSFAADAVAGYWPAGVLINWTSNGQLQEESLRDPRPGTSRGRGDASPPAIAAETAHGRLHLCGVSRVAHHFGDQAAGAATTRDSRDRRRLIRAALECGENGRRGLSELRTNQARRLARDVEPDPGSEG